MPEFTTSITVLASVAVLSYLIGSVAFGLLITRIMGLGDLRSLGSGNVGTSNVLRTGSKTAAALTLILDMGKGLIPVLVSLLLIGSEDAVQVAALSAFLGHLFPVWHGFRGGKGVATYFGVIYVMMPLVALFCSMIWLAIAFLLRFSSVAALAASAATPLLVLLLGSQGQLAIAIILAALIWIRHKDNIGRLVDGTEPRIKLNS